MEEKLRDRIEKEIHEAKIAILLTMSLLEKLLPYNVQRNQSIL